MGPKVTPVTFLYPRRSAPRAHGAERHSNPAHPCYTRAMAAVQTPLHPFACVRQGCGGSYGPIDLDGDRSCLTCGRSASFVPAIPCQARRCETCAARESDGLARHAAVEDCRHRSVQLAPHCAIACGNLSAWRASVNRRRRAPPSAPRNGLCQARNCRPCRALASTGQVRAVAVDCVHAKNRRAPHCATECERLREGERARSLAYSRAKRQNVGVG